MVEGEEKKSRFNMSAVWWGLVAIVIVGGLGTYVWLNSLRYEAEERANANINITVNINSELVSDTDGDGLIDVREEFWGTDPRNPDSDGDTYSDGFEIANGYNPKGEGKLEIYNINNINGTNTNN
ncbi:MAG: hypothetical protein ABIB97_00350 [Patescibacteria group bacterium]